ncbi:mitochondrial Complex I (CI) assembly protein NDUFAF7/MidA [Andalucia godoyi]|uniref:Protein arginine methyltransferase NDUFAF7 n=1 Tax=Andalucia godoyi TaxID=505711 RepID=A0A8K0AIW2_ANDGO|nr:mitochondrial Complex I (CI) assembly protein NDUFAF7/MidA [Andalucia godoyi]|eukprot:ANDGO_03754.mRNA.1 mitochondrial Complex I (CI) assembly protein NDUFAF7/MidA
MICTRFGHVLRKNCALRKPVLARCFSNDQKSLSIDRSGLFQWAPQLDPVELAKVKQPESDFARYLKDRIRVRGPIPVAEYMREALTNPRYGYYMNRDVFGKEGDFTTSPEISQLFGEMVGIWCVSLWMQLGKPSKMRIVEFGPGRGTLMADVARTMTQFPGARESISIHLVDASPFLKDMQYCTLLRTLDRDSFDTLMMLKTESAHSEANSALPVMGPRRPGDSVTIASVPVSWHDTLETIPDGPTLILAHEFFDALPVYQFQVVRGQWCERLVDIDNSLQTPYHFRRVVSQGATPAVVMLMRRARDLARKQAKEGDAVEVCPAGVSIAQDFAKRIGQHRGAALIIDYGEDHPLTDSLMAIRKHKFVDLFDNPGSADLSAWVDFQSLRFAAAASKADVSTFGSVWQRDFLLRLGIEARATSLLQTMSEKDAADLYESYVRLLDPEQMGKSYKVMAFASKDLQPEGLAASFELTRT